MPEVTLSPDVERAPYVGNEKSATVSTAAVDTDPADFPDLPSFKAASPPPSVKPAAPSFPDGGSVAWLTVLGAFLGLLATFGQIFAFGAFFSFYASHQLQADSASAISWIGSVQLGIFFAAGAPIGRIFDSYGPTPIMIAATLLSVFSIMMTSISTEYYQYMLTQGILTGLAAAMVFYPALSAISTHFLKYRASALGIAIAGSSLGGVVFPIMYQHLFLNIGFGWAVRVNGFITLVLCLFAVFTIKSRLPKGRKSGPWVDTASFKDVRFMLLAAGGSISAFGTYTPLIYIVDYAVAQSVDPKIAFYVLAVMNGGGVLGRIAPAILADILGRFNLLIPVTFLSGLLCLVFWMFAKSLAAIMIFSALYGFCANASIAVMTPCVAQISDIRAVGTRLGMLCTIMALPALGGGPAAGALLAYNDGSYTGLIALSGAVQIAGSLLFIVAKLKINSNPFARV